MEVKLVVVGGDAKPTEINVKLPAIIGRGRSAALTLPHPLVSRQHCELFESGGKLFVRDLGSLNGTFVGEEKIDEAALDSGSLLTVGNVTFRPIYGNQSGEAVDDIEFEIVDDDIESADDASADEVADVVDVEEVAEADPLDPPDVELRQTVKVEPEADEVEEEKEEVAEASTEKAPQSADSQETAEQDEQFLSFLDEDEEGEGEDAGSDDDDLNAFLNGFNQ